MNISAPQVRLASAEDFAQVAALLAELGRPLVTPEIAEAAKAVYARHIARPDTASLVAGVQGKIVGFMSLEYRERLNCVQKQAWIPDLVVTESARGLGAGRALLERGFRLARDFGCDRVTLESGYTRTVAHQVYLACGMSNDGYFFTLHL